MQVDYRRRLVAFLVLYLGCAAALAADAVDLPRKAGSGDQREAYPGVIVNYDAIHDAAGHRLRFIVTHPQHSGKRPVWHALKLCARRSGLATCGRAQH